MNFNINTSAIVEEDGQLRPFVVYALQRLQVLGHALHCDTQTLSESHLGLLTHQGINWTNHASEATISGSATGLLLQLDGKQLDLTDWAELLHFIEFPTRKVVHSRTTKETDIHIELDLFGSGKSSISTGIGFFDHMLDQIAKHALLDVHLTCKGDLHIDEHHTVEDVGIALGEALSMALGDKKGLERFGFVLPMDEAQSTVALDLSGRPYLVFSCDFVREYVGELPTEMVEHFFYSLAMNLKATLQISCVGKNDHHKVEACFKGFARALRQALLRFERNAGIIPSSKGSL